MSVELMSLVMKADLSTVAYLIPATDKRPEVKGYLSYIDKSVLLALADRGNADGHSIYPSVEWMAKTTGLTERAIQYALPRLKSTFPRILVVEQKQASRYGTVHYRIMVSALESVAQWKLKSGVNDVHPSGVNDAHPSPSLRGAPRSLRGERSSLRGEPRAPEPSVEPSVNHQDQKQHTAPAPDGAAKAKPAQGLLLESRAVDGPTAEALPPVAVPLPLPLPGATDPAPPGSPAPLSTPATPAPVPKTLMTAFDQAYTAFFGTAHPKMGGEEAKLAKGLLEQYGLPKCLEFVNAFFALQDPWLEKTGKGFSIFASKNTITKLITLGVNGHGARPARISDKWAGAKPGLVSL